MDGFVLWFKDISMKDIPEVGGKNASLGEMIQHLTPLGVEIPHGFALTTKAYRTFLKTHDLDKKITDRLKNLNVDNLKQLRKVGQDIRGMILKADLPKPIEDSISKNYQIMKKSVKGELAVSVRSSATAEDLARASFAGQQETFLNIVGVENVFLAIKKVFASLFNDRAIVYRSHLQFPEEKIAISVGIQQMVRSDKGASGVLFTLDTESGFNKVVLINAGFGLGELIVQGSINPDEYYVFKPSLKADKMAVIKKTLGTKQKKMVYKQSSQGTRVLAVSKKEQLQFVLTEEEIETLAKQACLIEEHYGRPMDIEWAKDGITKKLFILQARPDTIDRSHKHALEQYELKEKGKVLIEGRSVGHRIGQGIARVVPTVKAIGKVRAGEILVTDMTDPDWEPVMKKVSAIVTNRGGRTCHAAIVAREMGIPAVVGCGNATQKIKDGKSITVSSAEGDTGYIYEGILKFEHKFVNVDKIASLPVKIMMTIANPDQAFEVQHLPNDGVGLARLEFIIAQKIGIHPNACLEFNKLPKAIKEKISKKIIGYPSPRLFYIEKLVEGISTIGASVWPKPVIVRLSDFKSNEYANLLGGETFEPKEENPMLGFRGASRYISSQFKECFALECEAIKKVRNQLGLTNVEVMVPFVRTVEEARKVVDLLEKLGLKRGENGLRLIMMCEIPANILLAEEFLDYFDGFSIGSNDLTQLTLGIDRDSELIAEHFDERNPAVLKLLDEVITLCKRRKKSISICGQGPSDHPNFAVWLVEKGIECLSLNPDSVLSIWLLLSEKLKGRKTGIINS